MAMPVNAYTYKSYGYDYDIDKSSNYVVYKNDSSEVEMAVIFPQDINSCILFHEINNYVEDMDVYLYPFNQNLLENNELNFQKQQLYVSSNGATEVLKYRLNDGAWDFIQYMNDNNTICENVSEIIATNIPFYEVIPKPAKISPEKVEYSRCFNGKYFSKYYSNDNKKYIMFSNDGIKYDIALELPDEDPCNGIANIVYGNNRYIAVGAPEFMVLPGSKISWANYSKIMYILNDNFEIIGKSEVNSYRVCYGFYGDSFYFADHTENETKYFKSIDGINLSEITQEEYYIATQNIDRNKNININGIICQKDNFGSYLILNDEKFYISRETDYRMGENNFGSSKYWSGILSDNFNNFLTLDGIYPIAKLPDAESGLAALRWMSDEYFYYDSSDDKYYRMPISQLDKNTYVRLNDTILGFDQPPVMEDDRTLVPMRFLFEQMGAEVTWDEEIQAATASVPVTTEQEIRTFGLAEEKSVTFSVDNTTATVNGATATMDVPARLINDQTFVPLRFLSENLGYTVDWDEATNTAIITTE